MITPVAGGTAVLSTDRLVLRRLAPEDAPVVARYRSDPEVARLQSWDPPYTVADAIDLIDEVAGHEVGERGWTQLGVELRATGELIGDCGVNGHDSVTVELGFTLDRAHWHHGYATEACEALVDHLLGPLGFTVVVAESDPANAASIAVLERLRFVRVSATETEVHYAHTRPPGRRLRPT